MKNLILSLTLLFMSLAHGQSSFVANYKNSEELIPYQRLFGAMATYDDINFMVDNSGWQLNGARTNSNKCVTSTQLLSYVNVVIDGTYGVNQLVAWQDIFFGIMADISSKSIPSELGSFQFTLKYDYNLWSISDDMAWLTVSPTSGNGETLITASYDENTSTVSGRSGTITLVDSSDPAIKWEIAVTQAVNPGIATDAMVLNRGLTDPERCNTNNQSTYYIASGQAFNTAPALYSNPGGTVFAPSGWYNDGTRWRRWTGSAFTDSGIC